ncbi:MAG: hypothetical protein AAGD01_03415 [Acidobacteriota bacterium]
MEEEIRQRAESVRPEGDEPHARHRAWVSRLAPARERGEEVVVVAACRTPFLPMGGAFGTMDALDLASAAAAELISRAGLDPALVDALTLGCAHPPMDRPQLGREVVARASLHPATRNEVLVAGGVSGSRALITAARWLLDGEARVVMAGGVDALTQRPIAFSRNAARRLQEVVRAKNVAARVSSLGKLRFKDLTPSTPAEEDAVSGRSAAEIAEAMAQENDVSRRSQLEITLASHRRAAKAEALGGRRSHRMPTFLAPRHEEVAEDDVGIRGELTLQELAAEDPVGEGRYQRVSASSLSCAADGAALLLMMRAETARDLGLRPRATLAGWASAAVAAAAQPLQAPAHALAHALLRGVGEEMSLAQLDALELHEAAAAQVISNAKAWASQGFAATWGRQQALGLLDLERLNAEGGSLALGDPPAATGARLSMDLVAQLERLGGSWGAAVSADLGGHSDALLWRREAASG